MKDRDDQTPLSGLVQIDDVYWGGEQRGGKRSRGSSNKTPFVVAIALNDDGNPVSMHMSVVKGFKIEEISLWEKNHLSAGSTVISDGLAFFRAVKGAQCEHLKVMTSAGPSCFEIEAFKRVNTMIGNIKTSMHGAYHSINPKFLPCYLAEFCYPFNRGFELDELLPRFMCAALRTTPMPYRLLKMAEADG